MTTTIGAERYKNSQGILDPYKFGDTPILVVGAGGIGSTLTVTLAKMGLKNITVVDFDDVEDHNLQSQFYRQQDIGKLKTDALKEIVLEQAGIEIKTINSKFELEMVEGMSVVFTLVDDMDIRKQIVDSCSAVPHIIDCRMGGTYFECYNFAGGERSIYLADSWFPQAEADPTPCSEKSSCFNCFASAAIASSALRARLNGYTIPYKIVADTGQFLFDTSY